MRGDPRCDSHGLVLRKEFATLVSSSATHIALLGSSSGLTLDWQVMSRWQLWASCDQPGTSEPWWLPPAADPCQSKS